MIPICLVISKKQILFFCQGRECKREANGAWIKNVMNYVLPKQMPPYDFAATGDKYIPGKDVWFDTCGFECFALAPK